VIVKLLRNGLQGFQYLVNLFALVAAVPCFTRILKIQKDEHVWVRKSGNHIVFCALHYLPEAPELSCETYRRASFIVLLAGPQTRSRRVGSQNKTQTS
jgi:hypothetical protein